MGDIMCLCRKFYKLSSTESFENQSRFDKVTADNTSDNNCQCPAVAFMMMIKLSQTDLTYNRYTKQLYLHITKCTGVEMPKTRTFTHTFCNVNFTISTNYNENKNNMY